MDSLKIDLYSPLPPAKSGIADYTAALLETLRPMADVSVITAEGGQTRPEAMPLYQIGNNGYHDFVYQAALARPGVVVLHEANLHHLLAEITIKRQDWDGYVAECAYDGGEEAQAFALRVRRLEVGPDYEGVPMLRRVLERSRGVIVHSRAVANELARYRFSGPLARIPHGAWLPETGPRQAYRSTLGLDEQVPLVGIFGFLKPYKRIAEALRAFRRLLQVRPDARMILVGEAHPELPLAALLRQLDLEHAVRQIGFAPIDDFNGYIAACDIVLNLRFPTVGESSGTLLRALGMGKAVVVSQVGSFLEYPDAICLKTPVDAREEDTLFEYLNLLVSRPTLARAMGARARQWVEAECSWQLVAERYLAFCRAVANGTEWQQPEELLVWSRTAPAATDQEEAGAAIPASLNPETPVEPANEIEQLRPTAGSQPSQQHETPVKPEGELAAYIRTWFAPDAGSQAYAATHITRLERTLEITPPGDAGQRVLEMGAYLQITPALQFKLGYGEVRGCYYGPAGRVENRTVTSSQGESFSCAIDLFDAEKDPFPYPDNHFDTVLCCELLEHLPSDPMFLMGEINRVLKPGGHLVLTTPNIASFRALRAILDGYHPGFFPAYIRPSQPGEEVEARHNREYTPREMHHLFTDAGFRVTLLETGEFRDVPRPEELWIRHLLERYQLPVNLRGDGIYIVGQKSGPVLKRYPAWLYEGGE